MSEFWRYSEYGFNFVFTIRNYHFLLFLIALTIPYTFKEWNKVMLLAVIFTIGYAVSLLLSAFGVVHIHETTIALLVPATILIMAILNLFSSAKSLKGIHINIIGFITLFFGMIFGLAFSEYFKSVFSGKQSDKIVSLLEFAIGVASAETLIVIAVLILTYLIHTFFRSSKRDVTLVLSAFAIGVVVPEIVSHPIWK